MSSSTAPIAPIAPTSSGDVDVDESLLAPEMIGRLGRLSILARKLANARKLGRRRTRRIGGGVETIDMRAYVAGDDPRRIAWHAYARLERLLVRLVADEAPLRLALVVDQSASMGYGGPGTPTKLRQAARVAAGLAAVALGGEDRVALAVGSAGDARAQRAVSGRAGLPRILARLDRLAAVGATDLPTTVRASVDAAGGRALAVILSDLYEPQGVLSGAREARLRGHEVAIVEVLTPFEVDPPDLSGLELEDEETGEIVELPAHHGGERYREALRRHRAAIDEAAAGLGATVVRTTTAEPFEHIVMASLGAGVVRTGGAK